MHKAVEHIVTWRQNNNRCTVSPTLDRVFCLHFPIYFSFSHSMSTSHFSVYVAINPHAVQSFTKQRGRTILLNSDMHC